MDKVWDLGKPVLLVDAGDLFGRKNRLIKEQTRFLAEVTGSFGYDAIGLGEYDLNYGLGFLRTMIDENDLPFINANVRLKETGELLLPPYVVVEKGGVKFGIVSVMGVGQRITTMSAHDDEFIIDEPVEVLRELLPQVRREADTIVALLHTGDRPAESICKEVEGIDIAIVGHTSRVFREERVVGRTAFLAAGFEGRFMGRVDLSIEPETGTVKAFTVETTSLDDSSPEDAVMVERIDAFRKHMVEFKLNLRGKYKPTRGSADEKYMTQRSCQKCHGDVWDKIRGSGHQVAFQAIHKKGQADNPECIVCHVTGYLYKNGYDEEPPYNRLSNVQCEACHGYGSEHRRDGSMLEKARKACADCHDKENSPDFDYDVYWQKIAH